MDSAGCLPMPPVGFRLTHLYYFDLLIRLLTVNLLSHRVLLNCILTHTSGSVSFVIDESNLKGGRSRQKFWLGGAAPQTPIFGWGGKAPPDHPLNGRSSHLIEAAKRGRLDQMIFCSAPLTTRAPPGRPAGRPSDDRPTTVRGLSTDPIDPR